MFTAKEAFGSDASALFNHLTGYSLAPKYQKFIVAPTGIRDFFNGMVETEIKNAENGLPSGITLKVNSVLDAGIIRTLYAASNAGVKIKMIVRGICSLIPEIPGFSENIEIISIVGQLLEHSRIFVFENGGDKKYFLGSADLMPRNIERRVELIFPVEDSDIKARLDEVLLLQLEDTVNAREKSGDDSYSLLIPPAGEAPLNSQEECSLRALRAIQNLEQIEK
ncbi:MAG TPA: RNA degradosome polyphosphate kinase, partial [Ruminococcaceae bacterium]|nr:RNA degradosome polyphosphate kinase [Oscillospiraceae bacterium]